VDLARVVIDPGAVPWITVVQMREVDRVAVDEVGLSLLQMMENAGSRLADVARRMLGGSVSGSAAAVLAGSGGNGGGALAGARHLANAGARVTLHLGTTPDRLSSATRAQLGLAVAADVRIGGATPEADLLIDGLLGYGQSGSPRGRHAELVAATQGRRTVSLDVPSGLELATGIRHDRCVTAEVTMTLAAPKRPLDEHPEVVGRLVLADIGIPASVYRRAGIIPPEVFGGGPLVEIAYVG
jgi:NAD(P)H-hydrate epimerase